MAEVAEHAGSASVLLMQQGPTGKEASRMQCCEPAFSRERGERHATLETGLTLGSPPSVDCVYGRFSRSTHSVPL